MSFARTQLHLPKKKRHSQIKPLYIPLDSSSSRKRTNCRTNSIVFRAKMRTPSPFAVYLVSTITCCRQLCVCPMLGRERKTCFCCCKVKFSTDRSLEKVNDNLFIPFWFASCKEALRIFFSDAFSFFWAPNQRLKAREDKRNEVLKIFFSGKLNVFN